MNNVQHIKHMGIYLLIGIYSFVLLKPLIPFATDFIAHTFYALEHNTTVHFENGAYHVHKEVASETKNQDGQPTENNSYDFGAKIDAHYLSEIFSIQNNWIKAAISDKKNILKNDPFLHETSLKTTYPPPQV